MEACDWQQSDGFESLLHGSISVVNWLELEVWSRGRRSGSMFAPGAVWIRNLGGRLLLKVPSGEAVGRGGDLSTPVCHPTPVFGQGLFSAPASMFSMKSGNKQALSSDGDMWPPDSLGASFFFPPPPPSPLSSFLPLPTPSAPSVAPAVPLKTSCPVA